MHRLPAAFPRSILFLFVVLATYVGWRTFWFLTDDAFIAFRYVSNSVVGRGLVWNPAPFLPVEGYTSFLWCALLEWTWRLTGFDPVQSSNWIALAFGYATLWMGFRIFRRAMHGLATPHQRLAALAMAACLVLSNRTFLTWLSSGLETSLFNFCLTWWVYEALARREQQGKWWLARITFAATLAALARPDGLLFVAATVLLIALRTGAATGGRFKWSDLAWCAPLALVVAHLLWRHAFYGDWLPNTFYAKYTGLAPMRGSRFLASFVVEYGMWWPLLVLLIAVVRVALQQNDRARLPRPQAGLSLGTLAWIPVCTLVLHVGFYVVAAGGDHFEYRVLSHLPLLVAIAVVWLAFTITRRVQIRFAILVVYLIASLPIPWVHWLETRQETEYEGSLFKPVAHRFPVPVRSAVARWDDLQFGLIQESAGIRHQEHKLYYGHRSALLPTREVGSTIPWQTRPVLVTGAVGIAGWVLPHVAIIDYLGLNDRVIARTPPTHPHQLAHSHRPPEGYVDCFEPNVFAEQGMLAVDERLTPLTDQRIQDCEQRDWSGVPPNLDLELRRSRERRKRLYEIILDESSKPAP